MSIRCVAAAAKGVPKGGPKGVPKGAMCEYSLSCVGMKLQRFIVALTLLPSAYTSYNSVPIPSQVAVKGLKMFDTFSVRHHLNQRKTTKPVDTNVKRPGPLFLKYG